jgi:hypothetical protein
MLADAYGWVRQRQHSYLISSLLGIAGFALLWVINIPYRRVYQPSHDDVTALADGLLLLPGARWQDWFTQGHSHFFDAYPEWSVGQTAFARPAFQFLIYLAHFVLGKDWASYLAINYLCIAGAAAVAFLVARIAFGLGVGRSLVLAALVLLSPPMFEFSAWEVGYASEALVGVLIACAFLASTMRRDRSCIALLLLALFTKETALWAPFAACATVLLRRGHGETFRTRAVLAAAMLSPLGVWLGFRLIFYGGVGGTYATAGYTIANFAMVTIWKLEHLQNLFIQQAVIATESGWASVDRALRIGTLLLMLYLLIRWITSSLGAAWVAFAKGNRERRWPAAEPALLVSLWAAAGLTFYFSLAVFDSRYAASAVIFAWPAIGNAIFRHGGLIARTGLAVCLISSLARTSYFVAELNPPSDDLVVGQFFRAAKDVDRVLSQLPSGTQQAYVLFANGLGIARPDYIEAFLGTKAEIVRIIDTTWNSTCRGKHQVIAFDHAISGDEVVIHATVPECATLLFWNARSDRTRISDGRLYRSETVSYEFPDARAASATSDATSAIDLGHRVTVHIRPRGPARFIIGDSGPDAAVTWFDTP